MRRTTCGANDPGANDTAPLRSVLTNRVTPVTPDGVMAALARGLTCPHCVEEYSTVVARELAEYLSGRPVAVIESTAPRPIEPPGQSWSLGGDVTWERLAEVLLSPDGDGAAGESARELAALAGVELLWPVAGAPGPDAVLLVGGADHPLPLAAERTVADATALLAHSLAQRGRNGELEHLRALADRSDRFSSLGSMAAGVAHEIRNPLVSIRTFTQLLPERYEDDEFRTHFLDLTLSEIDRISSLVGELLAFAKPAGGADEVEHTADLPGVVDGTCRLLEARARAAGVELIPDVAEGAAVPAFGPQPMRQVLLNLLINAVDACRDGGRVVVACADDGERVQLTVRDDGSGLDATTAARVFDPFFTTRTDGTGLGLAIAKRLVEGAGGSIRVDSRPGDGAAFTVELPVARAPELEACSA